VFEALSFSVLIRAMANLYVRACVHFTCAAGRGGRENYVYMEVDVLS
jgi:hypothetical protein